VFADPVSYSAAVAQARLRKPTARAFSMKRVTALVPVIEATTARLLDAVGRAAEFDLRVK
jgi:cytochrome P450